MPCQAARASPVRRRTKRQQISTPGIPGQDQPEQGVDAGAIPNWMGFHCLGRHIPRENRHEWLVEAEGAAQSCLGYLQQLPEGARAKPLPSQGYQWALSPSTPPSPIQTTLSPPGIKSYINSIASYQICINKGTKHQSETAGGHNFPTTSWQNYNIGTKGKLQDSQCTKSQRNLTLLSTPNRSNKDHSKEVDMTKAGIWITYRLLKKQVQHQYKVSQDYHKKGGTLYRRMK